HIYTAEHVSEGIELLTGQASGLPGTADGYAPDTVLGQAQKTLQAYRQACQRADSPRVGNRRRR
ncbi:MAG TPA: hypothetical protein VLQ47_09985, partial [Rhodoferax sp.]|nr:hypothetical protein [Rhodoferax sp.]